MTTANFGTCKAYWLLALLFLASVSAGDFRVALGEAAEPSANDFLLPAMFLQIPGPNPILTAGKPGAWDDAYVEASDCIEDLGTYYLYYHGHGQSKSGYQLGVATAEDPLGPFVKHGDEPIVPQGGKGSWDNANSFCAVVVKITMGGQQTGSKYYMFYGGKSSETMADDPFRCDIGLATADHPLGPWTKHPDNPILEDFGYNGGVVEKDGTWYMINAYPISSTGGRDYSPMALATAPRPEGPWTKYAGNPVLKPGGWGEWDDGGFSEAKVFVVGDMFHMFYGGAKATWPRFESRESIGYAYSRDGEHWTKYGRNPVASRQAEHNAAAYAEVRALWEPPFVYCFHTLRYERPWRKADVERHPNVEDIGVQVLVTQRPFALDMPVLERKELPPQESTSLALDECRSIAVGCADSTSLTVTCRFHRSAQNGVRVHVRSSPDGETFDTRDIQRFEVDAAPGQTVRQTFPAAGGVKYLKVIVENLDPSQAVEDLAVTATLRG